MTAVLIGFPRSRERGPIEASTNFVTPMYFRNFRAHVSAAPLKRIRLPAAQRLRLAFPRSRERGPIEASNRLRLSPTMQLFPRSRERGPIEAQKLSA